MSIEPVTKAILASHTASRGVWLAVWRGWGWDYASFVPPATKFIATRERQWDLFRAPLDRMDTQFDKRFFAWEEDEDGFTANMIWPDDRNWFLTAEIDHNTIYIGGSAPLIEDLLAADDLEVWPAEPDDSG